MKPQSKLWGFTNNPPLTRSREDFREVSPRIRRVNAVTEVDIVIM